jgi:hypothetical protein
MPHDTTQCRTESRMLAGSSHSTAFRCPRRCTISVPAAARDETAEAHDWPDEENARSAPDVEGDCARSAGCPLGFPSGYPCFLTISERRENHSNWDRLGRASSQFPGLAEACPPRADHSRWN